MQAVLLIVHLLIALALVGVVLLQRSEGGALGMGGSSSGGNLFSARGAANMLTRTTAILASLFILTSLGLGLLAGNREKAASVLDTTAPAGVESPAVPAVPAVPLPQ